MTPSSTPTPTRETSSSPRRRGAGTRGKTKTTATEWASERLVAELLELDAALLAAAVAELRRFEAFAALIKTVHGTPLVLEDYQRMVLLAHFAGVAEILVLLPKGNGKTTLIAALVVYHLLTTDFPRVYVGAGTTKQANELYGEAVRILKQRRAWTKRYKPLPGYRAVYHVGGEEQGHLRILASDDRDQGRLEGPGATLGVVEEYQAHRNDAIYSAIQGGLHKRGGRMLTISTAGKDENSPLGRLRASARKLKRLWREGARTIACSEDRQTLYLEYSLPEDADPEDLDAVAAANPASFVTKAALGALRRSLSMTPARWLRNHCGLWASGEGKWLAPELWHACERPGLALERGERVYLGYDHARSYDHAALMAVRLTGDEAGAVFPLRHWRPEDCPGGKVPYWQVKEAFREACATYEVPYAGYDKLGGFAQSGEELEDEGLPMVEVSMHAHVWAPLTASMRAAIRQQVLEHPGDDELTAHVLAGEVKDSEHGERLHGRIGEKVDELIATGIAWYVATVVARANPPKPFIEVIR